MTILSVMVREEIPARVIHLFLSHSHREAGTNFLRKDYQKREIVGKSYFLSDRMHVALIVVAVGLRLKNDFIFPVFHSLLSRKQ